MGSGLSLMIGIEIVADKATRKPFDPAVNITGKIQEQAFKGGFLCVGFLLPWQRVTVVGSAHR